MKALPSRLPGIVLVAVFGIGVLIALGAGFLFATEAGTTWLLQQASNWSRGALVLGEHRGTLSGGLSVRSVRWDQDRLLVEVATAELTVSWLDLLDGGLTIDRLSASGIVIHRLAGPPSPDTSPSLPQPPLPIRVRKLVVKDVRWQSGDSAPIDIATLQLGALWNSDGLAVDELEVGSNLGSLSGAATVGGVSPHGLSGRLQLRAILPDLPVLDAGLALSGALADPELLVDIQAPYQATLAVKVNLQGSYSLAGPVSMALHDLKTDWPKIRFAGEIEGSGRGVELEYGMTLLVNLDDQPLVTVPLSLAGRISPTGTVISRLVAERGTEMVSGTGSVDWGDQVHAVLDLSIERLNPDSWWKSWSPEWPAQINGNIRATVTSSGQEGGFELDLTQLDLKGDLRDEPFQLSAAGKLGKESWQLDVIKADFGSSHGSAMVRLDEVLDAEATLVVPGIGEWLTDASGSASLKIILSGDPADPDIKLTVSGKELGLGDLDSAGLDLAIAGRLSRHRVSLLFSDPQSSLDAAWNGALKRDGLQVADYRGEFTRLNLRTNWITELQSWTGREIKGNDKGSDKSNDKSVEARPMGRFRWQRDRYALEQTCLDSASTRLCVAGNWNAGKGQGTLALTDFPLDLLARRLPGDYRIEGSADLVGSWRLDPAAAVHWQPELSLATSSILMTTRSGEPEAPESAADGTEEPTASLDSFRLAPIELTLQSGSSGPWRLELSQPDLPDGGLSGKASLAFEESDWRTSTIDGEIRANFSDVAFFGTALPFASDLKGQASGTLKLGGTLGRPGFEGVVEWLDGGFRLPAQGLTWTDVSMQVGFPALADSGSRRIDVTGRGTSGDGTLSIEGGIDWTGDITTAVGEGRVTGAGVRVLNTDLAQIHASPDLYLRLEQGLVSLSGEVLLPKARVRIRERPVSAVSVSEDQRLGGLPADAAQTPAYRIKADVDLRFGEDVQFTGFGLDTTLGGGIALKQRGRQTTATGSIVVRKGTYAAYGQKLAINRGRLLWSDTPLQRPAIDVDASRTPSKEITVGLRASGPIERPEVNLYSVPGMTQSEQLSWLLFGRPLQTTSSTESSMMNEAALALGVRAGDFLTKRLGGGLGLGLDQVGIEVPAGESNETAALVLGKYLTPDLYVSYGISLLQALSTLRIEYALSQDWRVVTESSAERNSADLFFVKERQ